MVEMVPLCYKNNFVFEKKYLIAYQLMRTIKTYEVAELNCYVVRFWYFSGTDQHVFWLHNNYVTLA